MENKELPSLGHLAVQIGFISKKQLEDCLIRQKSEKVHRPIGQVLLEDNLILPEQLLQLLKLQEVEIDKISHLKKLQREAKIFSQLIAKWNYLPENIIQDKLESYLALMDTDQTFFDFLIEEKCLTNDQIKEILSKHKKVTMYCRSCKKLFNVLSVTDSKYIQCPICRGLLSPDKPSKILEKDAELFPSATFKNLRDSFNKCKIQIKCVICFTEFEAIPDKSNKVTCQYCGTETQVN
ncbi:MAG: hypothetical protein HY606_05175 [Planctomycetes bacterium]|nr:hypothetical protein [Planctomycetota bacterium]